MSITVTITDARVETKSGTSSKTGRPYSMSNQRASVRMPNGEVRNAEVGHDDDKNPLPLGDYQPTDAAYYMDKDRKIIVSLRARNLVLLKAAK